MQDAAAELVVLQAELRAQRAQLLAAPHREGCDRRGVAMGARRQAFKQEAQAPPPLRRVAAGAKHQRCIRATEPAQDLRGRTGVGPRLRVADRDLAAVGEAGLETGPGLAVEQADAETGLRQVPGGRDAGQAGAENHDVHEWIVRCEGGR